MTDAVKVAVEPTAPAPVPEEKNPDRTLNGEGDLPIALYQELKGIPYAADYFDVVEIWDNPDLSLKDDIETIETAYRTKVHSGEIKDGKESYARMVREAEEATNSQEATPQVKIAKIAAFVRFMNDLNTIDKARRTYGG